MSNYPQDKFTAPNVSGNWRYWANSHLQTTSGSVLPITSFTGILGFNQDNLFINYQNKEVGVYRIGVMKQVTTCHAGKTSTVWSILTNNTLQNYLELNPYCYKNGTPTKMVSNGDIEDPSTSYYGVTTYYYEKL